MPRRPTKCRFHLKIGNTTLATFSEASVAIPLESINPREKHAVTANIDKLPGFNKFGTITMKRGVISSPAFSEWLNDVRDGARRRRNVVISVLDEGCKAETARFAITKAWPVKYDPSDLNAKGNEAIIETLELANEGIKLVE